MPPPFEPCQDLNHFLQSISGEHLFSALTKKCINLKILHKLSAKQLADAGFASGVADILVNARNHRGGSSGSMVRVRVRVRAFVHSCVPGPLRSESPATSRCLALVRVRV